MLGGIIGCDGSPECPCDFDAFVSMIDNFIKWVIGISATIATVTFAIAGGRILLNPNNSGERERALAMFKKSVYGLFFLLCAWVIVYAIVKGLTKDSSLYLKFLK
jgi:heme O synthase-like polyprenyltransferase